MTAARLEVVMTTLFLVLMLAAACAADTGRGEVTVSTCGTTAHVHPGGTLVVRLPSQVTTGYVWSVKSQSGGVVEALGEPRTERQPGNAGNTGNTGNAGDIDGGTEVQVFRFRAISKGHGGIVFHNKRPFEKDKPPLKTCTFQVEVEE